MIHTLVLALIAGNAPVAPIPLRINAEQRMLADLNASRRQAGLGSLSLRHNLTAAAIEHAVDMAQHHYFDHASRDGRSPFDRMHADGCHFAYAGENIALSDSESEAYAALLQSPEHRQNILNAHFKHVGIGIAQAPDGSLMFVQDFSD